MTTNEDSSVDNNDFIGHGSSTSKYLLLKVPSYEEVFLDEGDVDMFRALKLYAKHGYDGVMIPDHTPSVECAAPWHAGMAWALGYMRATIQLIESGRA